MSALPSYPWHLVNIWWKYRRPTTDFKKIEVDVTIDRDIPSTYNLYIAPISNAYLNGIGFYGGLQTNIDGWESSEDRVRVYPGKGAIFSRWSVDGCPICLDHVKVAAGGLCESAGYEGEFCSVRRPFSWSKGVYTFCVEKSKTEMVDDKPQTWFDCLVKCCSSNMITHVGSLRFEGKEFVLGDSHCSFLEIYSTENVKKPDIPTVRVTFGYPRINGQCVPLEKAWVNYNDKAKSASPYEATVLRHLSSAVVKIGKSFRTNNSSHALDL